MRGRRRARIARERGGRAGTVDGDYGRAEEGGGYSRGTVGVVVDWRGYGRSGRRTVEVGCGM